MSCPRSTTSTESAANLFARVGLSASCCVSGAGKRCDGALRSPIAGTHDAEVAFGSIASSSYFWLMSGLPARSEAAVIRSHQRSPGHKADVFSSAAEFLTSPRLAETACLIADIHMPTMTGLELYRRLIDTGHTIPTILVTAFPNDVDQARALNDGVTCYLRKPVDEEHLTRCVRDALRPAGAPEEEP